MLSKHEMNFNIFIIQLDILLKKNISYFNVGDFFCQTLDIAYVYKTQQILKKKIIVKIFFEILIILWSF